MKGMFQDRRKLQLLFGRDIDLSRFTDIEEEMLRPLGASLNFQEMVNRWSSKQLSAQFKDKKISCSNWEAQTLTTGQVLYAAFDVVSLHEVVKGLRAYIEEHPSEMKAKGQQLNREPRIRSGKQKGSAKNQSRARKQGPVKCRPAKKKTGAPVETAANIQGPLKSRPVKKKQNAALTTTALESAEDDILWYYC